jgi:hypothetical protein
LGREYRGTHEEIVAELITLWAIAAELDLDRSHLRKYLRQRVRRLPQDHGFGRL